MNKNITKEWFRKWSNEYDNTLGKIARHHALLELAVRLSGVKKGDRVLDIGCGTGLLSLKFLRKCDCRVTGIDNSVQMLAIFRKKIRKLRLAGRVTVKRQDAASVAFKKNTFDIAASTVTLHHLTDKLSALKRIYAVLKPGGRLVIGDIDLDTTGRLNDVKRLKRVMDYLKDELVLALHDGGVDALKRMFDNGKKHLLNDGEYCVSFKQWAALCRKAGFRIAVIKPLPAFTRFKIMVAVKAR
jgi:cyclopropane fatty-acyl-phospholipid synthase-like methyltransferase